MMPISRKHIKEEQRPFGLPWLDSCYQETLLPGGAWQKIHRKLCDSLAEKISKHLSNPQRKQMIFHLVGPEFVQRYFPDEENTPAIIEQPEIIYGDRKRLETDAHNWLNNTLNMVSQELHIYRPHQIPEGYEMVPEMIGYLQHTEGMFYKGMNRHLFLQQKEFLDQLRTEEWKKFEEKEKERAARQQARMFQEVERLRRVSYGAKGILKMQVSIPPMTASSTGTFATLQPPDTSTMRSHLHRPTPDNRPQLWGMESDSLGRSVMAILHSDPRKFRQVAAALHGKQLPGMLRTYMWLDVLLRKERQRIKDGSVERVVRERFGKAVARGVGDLKIKKATHSPISSLIDNAVIEIYDATPSMLEYSDNNIHMKEAASALNILYVYDRSYEPYLIHWLFPLQLAFQDATGQSDHVYELAMYLDLLNKSNFPTWPEIYAISERAVQRLAEHDQELHQHLCDIALVDPQINPKEFLVQVIHQEKSKAVAVIAGESKGKGQGSARSQRSRVKPESAEGATADLLTDPVVFLRKWVGQGFVGVLDTWAVVWAWDQFFMQKWQPLAMEDMCLAIMELLRSYFMDAKNYSEMKRVFLNEPCRIYTKDLQISWRLLQKGSHLSEIPEINRQALKKVVPPSPTPEVEPTPEPSQHLEPSPQPSTPTDTPEDIPPPPSPTPSDHLPTAAIRKLRAELVFTRDTLRKEHWLEELNVSSLRLTAMIYFDSIKLGQQTTKQAPVSIGTHTDNNGNTVKMIDFLEESFSFPDLDIAMLDLEDDVARQPIVILLVEYAQGAHSRHIKTLGWTLVKLYKIKKGEGPPDPLKLNWVVAVGDEMYPLWPGYPPPGAPRGIEGKKPGLITAGSLLGVQIYDPDKDGRSAASNRSGSAVAENASQVSVPSLNKAFDFYLDKVENIPDNASIVKVTGKLLKVGGIERPGHILALPELSGPSRSPEFSYRLPVNLAEGPASADMVLYLRLYVVTRDSRRVCVIGSCLCGIYGSDDRLLEGCHIRVLHSGTPQVGDLSENSLDAAPRVPVCRIYYRLTQHTDEPVAAPPPGDYSLDDDEFNESELRVLSSFNASDFFPDTEEALVQRLRDKEKVDPSISNSLWIENRLDYQAEPSASKSGAPNYPLHKIVRYNSQHGLKVKVARAYGIREGLYVQCFGRVLPESLGRDEKFVTLKHDYTSPQWAPLWMDAPKTLKPEGNPFAVIMLQVFGFKVSYTPSKDHATAGNVTDRSGQPLSLGDEAVLGWTVVPLFDGPYTFGGEHHVPLFRGKPDTDLLNAMVDRPAEIVIRQQKWRKAKLYDNTAIVVQIWDGHFALEHYPGPLERRDSLLDAVGGSDPYVKAETAATSKTLKMSQFVLENLERRYSKEGTNNAVYKTEEAYFSQLMESTFYNLMEGALMESGYGPL